MPATLRWIGQILNRVFWLASIGVWLWIVVRSEIWSADITSRIFWINLLVFLAAGAGTAVTTHFAASAVPIWLGLMATTAHDVKTGWMLINLYVAAAVVIGLLAGVIKFVKLINRPKKPIHGDP